jgi:hypothetical protein
MVITIDSKAFKKIMEKLDRIEICVKKISLSKTSSKWISEEEAMAITGLGKDSLRKKRQSGVFNYTTATGRKIQYLRMDIEKYLDNNSTIL